jgi:hypothetical protein
MEGSNKDGSKLAEIHRLWSAMPVHSAMTEVDQRSSSTARTAILSKKYKATAAFDEVKRFYTKELEQQNWRFDRDEQLSYWGRDLGGRALVFTKEDYHLEIQYAGGKDSGYEWDYSISVSWGGQ